MRLFSCDLLRATFLRAADKDKTAMEAAVEVSGLDWVILRPAILSDDPPPATCASSSPQPARKPTSSRAPISPPLCSPSFPGDEHLHQAVAIANG
jgi:uncharacterized protein YbjT (DUF2867 family)